MIADLNGLKEVNDTLGHQAGDALIRRAAEVLKASLEPGQTVARIGGMSSPFSCRVRIRRRLMKPFSAWKCWSD